MSREPEAADLALTPLALERGGTTSQPVIVARGEIDVATSPILRSELASVLAEGPDDVTLDLRGVSFVDEPHRIAEMDDHDLWMAFFRDPDEHLMAGPPDTGVSAARATASVTPAMRQ